MDTANKRTDDILGEGPSCAKIAGMTKNKEDLPAPSVRRGPRKVTEKRLHNVALHYLARYSASTESLRRVLMRRVQGSVRAHGTDPEEGAGWVEELIVRLQGQGYVDDRNYAEIRARSLLARGTSLRGIRAKLREKGVGGDDIDWALAAATEEFPSPDMAAAAALARRRRVGPYRTADSREERRKKDLASLARAGFSYDIACRVIDAESIDALEDMAAARADDGAMIRIREDI